MQALQWKSSSFIKSISYMAVCKELKVEIGSGRNWLDAH